ncbi:MAG: ligase-associated DNA damage response endonuclease PdeM [Desulfofustis sp.]|nr:ligase-associated DNA damage response endonuclease PdeM [Desulfofustis sp.]
MLVNPRDVVHEVCGQTLQLMPERSVFWREKNILLAADLHLGKEGTFRSAGIPLPEGPSVETLDRLDQALARSGATHLVVLGDLFHGTSSVDAFAEVMEAWRCRWPDLGIELIGGSHDRWSGDLPESWRIESSNEPRRMAPFELRHYPAARACDNYWLAGHLHPGVLLKEGKRGATLRLPCFYFSEQGGILPAFGSFTGVTRVEPDPGSHCYAVAGHEVVRIPSSTNQLNYRKMKRGS